MMLLKYFYIANQALRQRRDRSLLTLLSIIFGVGCITLLINFGLGARQQILNSNNLNENLLTIRSGQAATRNQDGEIVEYNLSQVLGIAPSLTVDDLKVVEVNKKIIKSTPIINLNEEIKDLSGGKFQNGHVIAANGNLLELIDYELDYGTNTLDSNRSTIIIGDEVAKELFNNSKPISHEIIIKNRSFIVVGVLKNPQQLKPLNIDFNYRRAVIMPFEVLEEINAQAGTETFIYEILAQTKSSTDSGVINELSEQILFNHKQKQDFTIFKNNELVFLTNYIFEIFRNLIIIISVIFLTIGGISLMNAMQASVAERKLEISIRKAVGATNQQILNQFLVEAFILSMAGGIIGVILALIAGVFIDYWTPVRPIIQLDVIALMLILAPAIGLMFGSQPAVQAAMQKTDEDLK